MTGTRRRVKAALYRLRWRLRGCDHRCGYEPRVSRRHRHPDGRPMPYHRCYRCLKTTWRSWA